MEKDPSTAQKKVKLLVKEERRETKLSYTWKAVQLLEWQWWMEFQPA